MTVELDARVEADTDDDVETDETQAVTPVATAPVAAQEAAPVVAPVDTPLLEGDVAVETPQKPTWDLARQRKDEELARLRKDKAELERKLNEVTTQHPSSEYASNYQNLTELDELAGEDALRGRVNELTRILKPALDTIGHLQGRLSANESKTSAKDAESMLKGVANDAAKVVNAKNPTEALPEVSARIRAELKARGYSVSNLPTAQEARDIARIIATEVRLDRIQKPTETVVKVEETRPDKGVVTSEEEEEVTPMTLAEAVREEKARRRKGK